MSQTPPQAHRDICAHEPCDNSVAPDKKYCCKRCAQADSEAPARRSPETDSLTDKKEERQC